MSKRALVIPANERWLHEPAMKEQLARADKWMKANPAKESNLDKLHAISGIGTVTSSSKKRLITTQR